MFEMAKIYFLVAIFLCVAVMANRAAPIEEFTELEDPTNFIDDPDDLAVDRRADRQRRVTCDLLSFGGKVRSSACAANCLSMGKAGGYCNGRGVCVCRRDTIGDLWKKRFG